MATDRNDRAELPGGREHGKHIQPNEPNTRSPKF